MARDPITEQPFASTTWTTRKVILKRAPQARAERSRRLHRWIGCYPWPRHQKISLTVQYKGGAECWYLLEARGRHGIFHGATALHDVMSEITQSL